MITLIQGLVLLATVAMSGLIAAQESRDSANEIVIGIPLPLTGNFEAFGLMMMNSLELAKGKIEKEGGIHGRPLRLVYADDRGNPEHAQEVITELIDQAKAVMLVGGYQSDVSYRLARLANARNVPFLICTAATDRITQKGWRNIYRLNPPISEYTKSLEDFLLKELRPKSMAIVYEDSLFGTDAAANMMSFLQDNGIEVRDLIGYTLTRTQPVYFRGLLAPLTREPPDVIHMVSYLNDGVILAKTIRELKIPSQLTASAAGFTHPEFLKRAGEAANGLLIATLWSSELPYPGAKEYYENYLAHYGSVPDYHGAEAYSALLVATDALRRARSLQPEAIRKALDQTYMKTPFGPVKFYSYADFERQNSTRTQVLQVKSGRFEIVWPPDLATSSVSTDPGFE